jgi:hypothetical protein
LQVEDLIDAGGNFIDWIRLTLRNREKLGPAVVASVLAWSFFPFQSYIVDRTHDVPPSLSHHKTTKPLDMNQMTCFDEMHNYRSWII